MYIQFVVNVTIIIMQEISPLQLYSIPIVVSTKEKVKNHNNHNSQNNNNTHTSKSTVSSLSP